MRAILTLATLALAVSFEASAIQPVNMDRAEAPVPEAPVSCSMQKAPVTGRLQNVCLTAGQRAAAAANAEAMANDRRSAARARAAAAGAPAAAQERLMPCQSAGCGR